MLTEYISIGFTVWQENKLTVIRIAFKCLCLLGDIDICLYIVHDWTLCEVVDSYMLGANKNQSSMTSSFSGLNHSIRSRLRLSTNSSNLFVVSPSPSSSHIADINLLSPPQSSKEPPEGASNLKIVLISLKYYNIVLIKVSITTPRMELST